MTVLMRARRSVLVACGRVPEQCGGVVGSSFRMARKRISADEGDLDRRGRLLITCGQGGGRKKKDEERVN